LVTVCPPTVERDRRAWIGLLHAYLGCIETKYKFHAIFSATPEVHSLKPRRVTVVIWVSGINNDKNTSLVNLRDHL